MCGYDFVRLKWSKRLVMESFDFFLNRRLGDLMLGIGPLWDLGLGLGLVRAL